MHTFPAGCRRAARLCRLLLGIPACLSALSGCLADADPDDASTSSAAALDAASPSPPGSAQGAAQAGDAAPAGAAHADAGMDSGAGPFASDGSVAGGDATQAREAGGAPSMPGDAASAGIADGADASRSSGPTFHVFLLLGQSNMAGYPKAQAADKLADPRVRVLGYDNCAATGRKKDVWDTAAPPLHECWSGAIGPGDYFAKTLLSSLPEGDTIGLVPCAISGEKIETFMKVGGSKYSSIVSRGRLAQQAGGVVEGILFHQGESNCGDPNWPGKVKTLVTDLRTDLGLGEVPFLAGELAPDGACANHNPLVNKLPGMIANAHAVSAQGLGVDPADTQWRLHFDHASQVTFGKRYAQTLMNASK